MRNDELRCTIDSVVLSAAPKMICRVCDNDDGNRSYATREMMFGYRNEFVYFECSRCGCLQIGEFPRELSKYYPEEYISFKTPTVPEHNPSAGEGLRAWLRRKGLSRKNETLKYYLNKSYIPGMLLESIYKLGPPLSDYPYWLPPIQYYPYWMIRSNLNLRLSFRSRILDVGSGTGDLLLYLRAIGFSNLLGVDPFIEADIDYGSGVKVIKKYIDDLTRRFDFIMLHHSFEHMPDPLSTLRKLYELLKPRHFVLIRTPVAGTFAWRKYGVNWVQLDPPRHLHVHSVESMKILAERSGFQVADVVYDSNEFQFWASEQYLRDIPLKDPRSYDVNPSRAIFSQEEIKAFAKMSVELNRKGDGDQACFFLYKP